MINRRFSRTPWREALVSIRGQKTWAVRNGHRDPIAIIYTGEADARLMAASPRLLGSLKHMIAIVRMHEGELRASEKAKYAAAQTLVKEIEG
jgi:hypothetical protein